MSLLRFHIVRRFCGMAVAVWVMALQPQLFGAETDMTAYEIKAQYLLNFAKWTEWPKEAMGGEDAPFVLGILGQDPFGKDIDIIRGQSIKGRKVIVKRFAKVQEIQGCHLLFISSSETEDLPRILRALEKSSILTIAEVEGFIQQRGMINLVAVQTAEQKKTRKHTIGFEINRTAAEKANLKLDTRLLELAKRVIS